MTGKPAKKFHGVGHGRLYTDVHWLALVHFQKHWLLSKSKKKSEITIQVDLNFSVMLYAMMTGVLPFNSDKSNDQVTLIPKVLKGLGSEQHRLDLMKLSVMARSLIKRCLKVDSLKRITSGEIFDDPWIYLDK